MLKTDMPSLEIRDMDGNFAHPITPSNSVMTDSGKTLDVEIHNIDSTRDGLNILSINKQEYDSLVTPDANTMYLVTSTPTDVPVLPSDNWYGSGTFDAYMAAGAATIIHENILYILGQGVPSDDTEYTWDSFYAMDITSGAVSQLPSIPSHPHPTYPDITSSRLGKFNNIKLHIHEGCIIFMTNDSYDIGDDPARVAKSYNISTKEWTELPQIPGDKYTSICFSNNYAYLVGGLISGSMDIIDIVYRYDINSGLFNELCRLPNKVYYPFTTILDGVLFVISGVEFAGSMYGKVSNVVQTYNIFDSIWDVSLGVFPLVTGMEPTRFLYLDHGCCNINNMIYMWSTSIPSIEVDGILTKLESPMFSINSINGEFMTLSQVPLSIDVTSDSIRYISCTSDLTNIYAMAMATDITPSTYDTNIMRYGGKIDEQSQVYETK